MGAGLCRSAVAPEEGDGDGKGSTRNLALDTATHPTVLLAVLRANETKKIELEGGVSCPPLTLFPQPLLDVTGLKILVLRKTMLTCLPDNFGEHLATLVELEISDGHLIMLPPSIGKMKALRKLTVFKNHLKALPEELGDCSSLAEINFFDNHLTELPRALATLQTLEDLNVGSNRLTRLPPQKQATAEGAEGAPEPRARRRRPQPTPAASTPGADGGSGGGSAASPVPDLGIGSASCEGSADGLEGVEEDDDNDEGVVYTWPRLRRLALHMNKLTSLPDLTCAAGSLATLQINENKLTALPALGPASRLALLDASKNLIAALPEGGALSALSGLTSFSVKQNALTRVPRALGACTRIETLNLEANPGLTALPDEVGALPALKVLLLKDSGLCVLPLPLARSGALARLSLERTPLALALINCGATGSGGVVTLPKEPKPRSPAGGTPGGAAASAADLVATALAAAVVPAVLPPAVASQQSELVRVLVRRCDAAGGWCKM